jgi:hypothetical protein
MKFAVALGLLVVLAVLLLILVLRRRTAEKTTLSKELTGTQDACNEAEIKLVACQREAAVLRRLFLATTAMEIFSELAIIFRENPNLWADPPKDLDSHIETIGMALQHKTLNQLSGEIDVVLNDFSGTLAVISFNEDRSERNLLHLAKSILEKIERSLPFNLEGFVSVRKTWHQQLQRYKNGENVVIIAVY